MKKQLMVCMLVGCAAFGNTPFWGATGHRVVGEVAQEHLTAKAKRSLKKILNGKSLALVSTFADDIKSDKRYKAISPWHYVNIASGKKYGQDSVNEEGDIVVGIEKCIAILKDKKASAVDREFYLKLLIHFIGDLHQPLHVGRPEDKGGNDIKVQWFGKGSNLHRVWDSEMIDSYGMSYTEIASNLPAISKKERKALQQGSLMDWIYESQALADTIYASAATDEKLGYEYMYQHFELAKKQLQTGGIRLAKVLNSVFEE